MWIAYIAAIIVCIVFGIALYGAKKEIWELREERLKSTKQISTLVGELIMHRNVKMTVVLTLPERRIILDALYTPGFKDRITDPKTRKYIRDLYRTTVEKMKASVEGKNGQV